MLISDIHLRDYHRYNKFPNQRLNSFVELAKDIVSIGKDNDIDTMLIGGDIVDKNTLSPAELHTLFTMFTELAKQFRIYSIIGNHDAKSKKSIDKEDTVITLLETIPGISFHHQEILNIGGRAIALENWVPEYDLSWIENPVDIYMSHATIDYNNTGLYGMDTSVFDGKFTVGVFGDIHVTSQLGNLISIGNTKQESMSDKYQGGVMIMDLNDLSYERIPIDPEHVKYLHMIETDDEDEEGWVDKDGEDMTYKVYKPAKVKSKSFELKLPKITDIEVKTKEVMESEGLGELHDDIKESSNYEPIDFNFSLNYLKVKNFRSIAYYNLDLSNNYIITGHTGSGKSTLITALFYALIGNKKLKSEIKYGESSCQLQVSLDYQGINYVITRGTGKGDFGLMVDNVVKKYNSKSEFEKEVYEYLPFLNYHESFFFNYWDTELLGNLKVDRRYDLLAKYYRLDALTNYNDIAEARFKIKKKDLKTCKEELSSLTVLKDSRLKDYENKLSLLEGKPTEKDIQSKIESHKKYKLLQSKIESDQSKIDSIDSEIKQCSDDVSSKEALIASLSSTMTSDKTEEELLSLIDSYSVYTALETRISKGESLIENIKSDINVASSMKTINEEQLENLLGSSSEENLSTKDLEVELENIKSKIETIEKDISEQESSIKGEGFAINSKIEDCEKDLDEAKKSNNSICSSCNQPVCNEDHIKLLEAKLETFKESKSSITDNWKKFLKTKEIKEKEIKGLKDIKGNLHKSITEINLKIEKQKENKSKIDLVQSKITDFVTQINDLKNKLKTYESSILDLKEQLSSLTPITEDDYISYKSNLSRITNINSEKVKLNSLKELLKEIQSKYENTKEDLLTNIKNDTLELSYYEEMSSNEYEESLNSLNLYSQVKSCEDEFNKSVTKLVAKESELEKLQKSYDNLESYCSLTSRSGVILKAILEELTKTFSSPNFKFTTAKVQANGKVVTDMSVSYLVGKRWIPYSSLSSGQRTLCDLYYISKIITGVGIVSFDETLRFLDDENLKLAVDLIDSIKKSTLLISTHSSNLSMEGTMNLKCELKAGNTTDIDLVV